MLAGNGVAGECHRPGPQQEHLLGEPVIFPFSRILQDVPRGRHDVDFLGPVRFAYGLRHRTNMLLLLVLSLPPNHIRLGHLLPLLRQAPHGLLVGSVALGCRVNAQNRV